MPNVQFLAANHDELADIQRLAHKIWHAHYPGIITRKQIDYMLETGYAIDALANDLENHISFELLMVESELRGFAAWGPSPAGAYGVQLMGIPQTGITEAKLHKLYLDPSFHGQGLGSMLLAHTEQQCREVDVNLLSLAVNKQNVKAIAAYRRNGFTTVKSVFNDIGDGFFMDDYIMAKPIV